MLPCCYHCLATGTQHLALTHGPRPRHRARPPSGHRRRCSRRRRSSSGSARHRHPLLPILPASRGWPLCHRRHSGRAPAWTSWCGAATAPLLLAPWHAAAAPLLSRGEPPGLGRIGLGPDPLSGGRPLLLGHQRASPACPRRRRGRYGRLCPRRRDCCHGGSGARPGRDGQGT